MIEKKKILIVRMGYQRDNTAFERAAKHKSKLMDITLAENTLKLDYRLKENQDIKSNTYDAGALLAFLEQHIIDGYDLVFGFVDRPVNRFSGFRDKCMIIGFGNNMDEFRANNVSLRNFILYTIYSDYARKYLDINTSFHESPGCLMDYGYLVRDFIAGCTKPMLCEECETMVTDKQAMAQMNKELKKIRVPLYVRLIEQVKQRTVLSMFIAAAVSMLFGIVSNLVAAWALNGFWQSVVAGAVPFIILCILVCPFVISRKNRK